MSGCTVLALSQSGRTPDVVEYARQAKRRGAYTVAITNDPASELAVEADAVLELRAGDELAVAATKTYSNQVAALGLLAAHAAGAGPSVRRRAARGRRDDAAFSRALEARIAQRRQAVRVRGPDVRRRPRRRVRDCARDRAQAPRDVPHRRGAADRDRPRARPGRRARPALPRLGDRLRRRDAAGRGRGGRARARGGRDVIASGSAAESIPERSTCSRVRRTTSPLLAPLLSVVPGQLFAWALARARGLDPDEPRGLSKVTLAR